MNLMIGLMSGTSMDGIDAALVNLDTHTLLAGITRPYGKQAKKWLQAVLNGEQSGIAVMSQLNTLLGREFAAAVHQVLDKAKISPAEVVAIGSHGQTLCHDATAEIPYTVQLGCAHTIAELTGITVVADFRTRDLVIGGQGAPFAPIYHQTVFNSVHWPMGILNIGGIANITYLAEDKAVTGYDVGPGNCLLDNMIQQHLSLPYDASGAWAASGSVIEPLLSAMLSDPYFQLAFPKSLGKEYFSHTWLAPYLKPDYAPEDIQATLLALTATTIAKAIKQDNLPLKTLAICGGGVHNTQLLMALRQQLPHLKIISTADLGVDPDYLEAMMFAFLADRAINHIPTDLKSITGSTHPAILGAIYARGIDK